MIADLIYIDSNNFILPIELKICETNKIEITTNKTYNMGKTKIKKSVIFIVKK